MAVNSSKCSLFITGIALSVSPTALLAKDDDDTLSLKPNGEWQLRAFDDKCRVSRTFGIGEDETTLWIDKGGPGPAVNLTVIGDPVRNPYGAMIKAGFTPGEMTERNYIISKSSKGRPVIAMFGVQPTAAPVAQGPVSLTEDEASEETVDLSDGLMSSGPDHSALPKDLETFTGLQLAKAVRKTINFQLDGFNEAVNDLLQCTEELTNRLNANSYLQRGTRAPPKPDKQAEWASKIQANYPYHLLREKEEGMVGVRLTVNAKGRATYCEVIEYSGPASFNDTACLQMLRHSRFTPARDSEGNPVPAFFTTRIIYMLR